MGVIEFVLLCRRLCYSSSHDDVDIPIIVVSTNIVALDRFHEVVPEYRATLAAMNLAPSHVSGCLQRLLLQPTALTRSRFDDFFTRLTSFQAIHVHPDGIVSGGVVGPTPFVGVHIRSGDGYFVMTRDGTPTSQAPSAALAENHLHAPFFHCARDAASRLGKDVAWYDSQTVNPVPCASLLFAPLSSRGTHI
jgi:hypothetical protein